MTPRSLVGMTMGARKRCGADYLHALTINRLGKRLRPCPGCAKCGSPVRRFVPAVGWCRPRDWVLWDGAKLWRGGRRWRRPCPIVNLRDYVGAADRGTWKELFCYGAGVFPARAKTVPQ